jgi:hypothetical protein
MPRLTEPAQRQLTMQDAGHRGARIVGRRGSDHLSQDKASKTCGMADMIQCGEEGKLSFQILGWLRQGVDQQEGPLSLAAISAADVRSS